MTTPEVIEKTWAMRAIELGRGGQDIRDIIEEAYNRLGTWKEVAAELGVSLPTLHDWLSQFRFRLVSRIERKAVSVG